MKVSASESLQMYRHLLIFVKVYLPAIDGLVPPEVVRAARYLLEFAYLVRRDVQTTETVKEIEGTLERFHHYREFCRTHGVRADFSLPRQHSLEHYADRIWEFAAPNALCSSITELKHIKAVKEPWRRSNRYDALDQMLLTNQRMDKLAAARINFADRGRLTGSCLLAMRATLLRSSSMSFQTYIHQWLFRELILIRLWHRPNLRPSRCAL